MRLATVLLVSVALLATACSKVKDALSAEDRIDTITNCFPNTYDKVDQLFEIAATFRLNTSQNTPDPAGLSYSQLPDGSIDVDYAIPGTTCVIEMLIKFYDPDGVEQNLTLTQASPLSALIDEAAGLLATPAASPDPFMVGDWTLTDTSGNNTASGSGTLTAMIGGTANQNELELLLTSTAMPAGGPPPGADSTIVHNMANASCTLTFRTVAPTHLETDTVLNQQYPMGTVSLTLVGPKATVNGTVTFNGTVIAVIDIDGLPASFSLNLETLDVNYNG